MGESDNGPSGEIITYRNSSPEGYARVPPLYGLLLQNE